MCCLVLVDAVPAEPVPVRVEFHISDIGALDACQQPTHNWVKKLAAEFSRQRWGFSPT